MPLKQTLQFKHGLWVLNRGENLFAYPAGYILANAAHVVVRFLPHKDTLLAPTNYQDCKVPFQRTAASTVKPHWCPGMRLFHPKHRNLPLPLLNFIEFLCPFIQLVEVPSHQLCSPESPRLILSTALQRTQSCQPSTPAVDEGDEQDQLQCQSHRNVRLLSVRLPVINHYYISSPYLLNENMWILCKSMSKVLLNLQQTSTAFHLPQSPAFYHSKHSG